MSEQTLTVIVHKKSGATTINYSGAALYLNREQARSLAISLAVQLGLKVTDAIPQER